MGRRTFIAAIVTFLFLRPSSAQSPEKVDFGRDVQPILKQYCIGCHGPTQRMNGFRLDRRRDAMRGGTIAVIGPGNSQASRLYLRLVGTSGGPQMPPTGALSHEKISVIKDWIDQGAEWPDALSGETTPVAPDPKANRAIDALRAGDAGAFRSAVRDDPTVGNRIGAGGSTTLMHATLCGDAAAVRLLLDNGADPNVKNEAGATALMWVGTNVDKARLLVDRGADVNATSEDGRTPLIIAAGLHGSTEVVRLLIDRGASLSAKAPSLFGDVTALVEAAYAGNEPVFRLLVERGADVAGALMPGLGLALRAQCMPCAQTFLAALPKPLATAVMMMGAPPLGPALGTNLMLAKGADVHARDHEGRTALMLAAASDALPIDAVKALIAGGADVNAKTAKGETALGFARLRGSTPIVDLLVKAGATDPAAGETPAMKPAPATTARAAVERSLPLLQKTDVTFLKKSGCVSCHNNTLTMMTVAAARGKGVRVDDRIARQQRDAISTYLDTWRERALQGLGIPGDSDTVSYMLLGLAAENHPADAATEAMARFLKRQQMPTGQWRILAHRPPIESTDIQVTAASMRALQVYAPTSERADYDRAVQIARDWLLNAEAGSTEERAFQLLGLSWALAGKDAIRKAADGLVATERPDGGWAQIPSLASDAYATGQALVALRESGAVPATDAVYARGVKFLLSTQLEDGSWFVKTRALPIQPHFESDFPHGRDQFISVAATNWATMALALTTQ